MFSSTLIAAIITHLLVSSAYVLLIAFGRSSLSSSFILIIFFIPVFGFLAAIAADLTNFLKDKMSEPGEIEKVKLEEDIYWKSIREQGDSENIVPLEEALIINDRQTRKKLMLEMLLDDPMKNIDILLLARENSDVDTAHYANTTIAKIQRDFQLQVQQLASAYESEPDNVEILDRYIKVLGKFIESGLLESYLLRRQRLVYGTLLEKRISLVGLDKDTLQEKIHNALAINDINTAIEANLIMRENYPDDENTWINELKISVAGHDRVRLSQTIETIKSKRIDWSITGKEQVSMWVEV